jgi:transcriptional regulator with XRE-family HTH domain
MGRSQRSRPKKLAYKLRCIRENFDLTQQEMVKELKWYGLKRERLYAATISQFESGVREPSLLVLLAYSKYSGIPVNSLIDDEIDPFTKPKH